MERPANQIVPAAFRPLGPPVGAADDQPVGGARHGDVEQAAVFVLGFALRGIAGRGDARHVVLLASRPDHGAAGKLEQPRRFRPGRRRRGVGENDDRRFQPLGAVHGHDAHFVAGDFHVAFDFGLGITQPGNKSLQRRRVAPLVIEREIEELVQRVVGLDSKPAEEAPPRAA